MIVKVSLVQIMVDGGVESSLLLRGGGEIDFDDERSGTDGRVGRLEA